MELTHFDVLMRNRIARAMTVIPLTMLIIRAVILTSIMAGLFWFCYWAIGNGIN